MKKNKTEKLFILLGCEKYDKIVVQKMKEIHEYEHHSRKKSDG